MIVQAGASPAGLDFAAAHAELVFAMQTRIDHVIPLLQGRGYVRSDYGGITLRDNLGLDHPANRYTATGLLSLRDTKPPNSIRRH
ncbi:hypothetical protein [Rhizobium lusitanum]|uniref:hypothetical protein n=1 Tax=Rhizobium lusitanum TaxID=293958 RepID=UPI00195433D5